MFFVPVLLSSHVFADSSVFAAVLLPCFELLSVRDASHFCWRPSFGVCLSVLRQVFADGPVLGYICPFCVTFLLTSQFWGISVHAASRLCWQRLFEPIAIDPRILLFKVAVIEKYICPCCITFCWRPSFWVYLSVLHHVFADGSDVTLISCLCHVLY